MGQPCETLDAVLAANGSAPALVLAAAGGSSPPSSPSQAAAGAGSKWVSRAALHAAIVDMAGRLREAGVQPGQAVALAFDNSVGAAAGI